MWIRNIVCHCQRPILQPCYRAPDAWSLEELAADIVLLYIATRRLTARTHAPTVSVRLWRSRARCDVRVSMLWRWTGLEGIPWSVWSGQLSCFQTGEIHAHRAAVRVQYTEYTDTARLQARLVASAGRVPTATATTSYQPDTSAPETADVCGYSQQQ